MNSSLAGILKSKTMGFNSVFSLIVITAAQFGYEVTTEQLAVIYSAINIILRFLTKTPLSEKATE